MMNIQGWFRQLRFLDLVDEFDRVKYEAKLAMDPVARRELIERMREIADETRKLVRRWRKVIPFDKNRFPS